MHTLTIGELAQHSGIHLETIRYYEREGLMLSPPRTPGGHRAYPPNASRRLHFIKRAQELGFSLAEIRELLDIRQEPTKVCTDAAHHIETKLDEVRQKIQHLKAIERALQRLTNSCDGHCHVEDCPILESFDSELS